MPQNNEFFFKTHPRVCGLILASTTGSRLFPMTSQETPKHLLPIAGIPCILRLLETLSSFPQIVVAVAAEDTVTLSVIQQVATLRETPSTTSSSDDDSNCQTFDRKDGSSQSITLIHLEQECFGPIDAVRQVEQKNIIHNSTRLVIFPGDLVFLQKNINMDALTRSSTAESACTTLLVDVGEVDEHGQPIKESAKAKKGCFSRDEEDVEYIGLSYPLKSNRSKASELPRIILKQSKVDVEADDMSGSTPKLQLPKSKLRYGSLLVRTEWNDVHVYSMAPWVRQLIRTRKGLSGIQGDLLPLLIARQFKGRKATFGKSLQEDQESAEGKGENSSQKLLEIDEEPYTVLAEVLPPKTAVRANTVSSYLYACREVIATGAEMTMPENSKWNGKFQSLVLENSTLGAKLTMKSSVVGKDCQLGPKCRLNNVVIMDNVTIGENCSLQNSLIGAGARLGNNCSLNDCQVGPGKDLPAGTKEKGESFMVGDAMEEEML